MVGQNLIVLSHLCLCAPVAEHCRRSASQTSVGVLDSLFRFLIIEIETRGESIRGLLVEVVLRHSVVIVADERESLLEILIDLCIDLSHRLPFVLRI